MLNRCVLLDNKDRLEDNRRPAIVVRLSGDRPPVTIADRETGTRSRRRRIHRDSFAHARAHAQLVRSGNGRTGRDYIYRIGTCVMRCMRSRRQHLRYNDDDDDDGYCFRSDGKSRRIVSILRRRRRVAGGKERGSSVVATAPRCRIVMIYV